MGKRSFLLLTACFCLFVLTGSAFGQETTGGIEGTVKDAAGAVVPNVSLTITTASGTAAGTTTTGIGAGFRRVITTNGDGFFRALQVPPGTYDVVTTASSGFGESRYENVLVTIGQNTSVNITVNAGTSVNTVDVVANDAAPVDTTSSGLQETINAQSIELIPKSTGFASLLKTIPGTRPESRTGGYSVDGSSGGENVFVIDGQEITNYRTGTLNETYNIPTQLVQEVQVRSTGFEAAYGGATGGVVSVVTRGGGDNFHGEIGIQFEVPKLNGKERPLLNRLTFTAPVVPRIRRIRFFPQKARGNNYFPTFNLGGPISRNISGSIPAIPRGYLIPRSILSILLMHRRRHVRLLPPRLIPAKGPISMPSLVSTGMSPTISSLRVPFFGTRWSMKEVSRQAHSPTSLPPLLASGRVPTANFGGTIGMLTGNDYTRSKAAGKVLIWLHFQGYGPREAISSSMRVTREIS